MNIFIIIAFFIIYFNTRYYGISERYYEKSNYTYKIIARILEIRTTKYTAY